MLQEELMQLQRNMSDLDKSMEDQRSRLQQITQELNDKNKQQSTQQNTLSKIRLDIMELESIEYPSENEVEILVSARPKLIFSNGRHFN